MDPMDVPGHTDSGSPTTCDDPACAAALARGDRWIGPHCSVEADGRAHFHHIDILHASVRAANEAAFTEIAARLALDPDDFPTAWSYLQRHPIFHRPRLPRHLEVGIDQLCDGDLDAVRSAEMLEDCDGLRDLYMSVTRDERGRTLIVLEHGPHLWFDDIDPARWHHFPAAGQATHDCELDVYAPTYEIAVIDLAAKVRGRYGDDRSRVSSRFETS
jgi:hypothetical protein